MDKKYQKLFSNTVILAIGTFSSKVLVFLLMPLYTRVLTQEDYGTVDLIIQACNLLGPLVVMGIVNSVVRFGLDRSYHKSDVFTTGLFTTLIGFVVVLLFWPLLAKIKFITDYMMLVYVFLLTSNMRALCSQFTRARGLVRLFALDGIFSTVTTILFNLLYLVVLKWGITGYVLAIISSDAISVVFLFFTGRLYQFVKPRRVRADVVGAMLRYALPLIPATLFWWVTNVSDRYIVSYQLGSAANGLLAASYKIPTVIVLVANIFQDAWQMSAVTEGVNRERFFSRVFHNYQAVLFTAASGLILFTKLITKLMVSEAFYDSWKYVPFLVVAMTYSCMVTFQGTIYTVEKRSVNALLTTMVGALINVVLNFTLIPKFQINGAAFATFISYFVVFFVRMLDTRRMIAMKVPLGKMMLNTGLLLVQCALLIGEVPHWLVWEIVLTAVMVVVNLSAILASVMRVLERRKTRRPQR